MLYRVCRQTIVRLTALLAVGAMTFVPAMVAASNHHIGTARASVGSDLSHGHNLALSAVAPLRPILFEQNIGQSDERVRFLARGGSSTAFITADGMTVVSALANRGQGSDDSIEAFSRGEGSNPRLSVGAASIATRVTIEGTSALSSPIGGDPTGNCANYLIGSNAAEWKTNVPLFRSVVSQSVYAGIDLIYRASGSGVEPVFVIAPGASVDDIRVRITGPQSEVDESEGSCLIDLENGAHANVLLVAYQADGQRRLPLASRFTKNSDGAMGLELGIHDPTRTVTVALVLSSLNSLGGGAGYDNAVAVTTDASGASFVTGYSQSTNFPTTIGAFDTTPNRGNDIFVTKISPDGATVVYSTYLGGEGNDLGSSIAVDSSGAAFVTGSTSSVGFPTTAGAYDTTSNGEAGTDNAFLTKLSATGSSLAYSTYFGGSNGTSGGDALILNAAGQATVVGTTSATDLPTTPGAYDRTFNGSYDCFVTRFGAAGSTLAFSSYIGGPDLEIPRSAAGDSADAVYIVGVAYAGTFPVTVGAYDTSFNGGGQDLFIAKLSSTGAALQYSTYLGGTGTEYPGQIVVDNVGSAYIAGYTGSTNYPTTAGVYDSSYNGGNDVFVSKLNAGGSALDFSTFIGAGGADLANALAVDSTGAIYVAGTTNQNGYPTTSGAYDTTYNGGVNDSFVTKLAPGAVSLVFSSLLGGSALDRVQAIAVDPLGRAVVAGYTESQNFPVVGGIPATQRDGQDAFVTKLSAAGDAVVHSTVLSGDRGSGEDVVTKVARDSTGATYCTGYTDAFNFPTTPGTVQPSDQGVTDAFVSKLSPDGSTLVFSTYIGGSSYDYGGGMAVDSSGNAFCLGFTQSSDFPTTAGALDVSYNGAYDLFLVKLSPMGQAFGFSTFIGGSSSDELDLNGYGSPLTLDSAGNIYGVGESFSSDFPTTPGAYDRSSNGATDAVVFKINSAGSSLAYSSYLGGVDVDYPSAVAVDMSGSAFVTGSCQSVDFPTTAGAYDTTPGAPSEVFVTKFNPAGSSLAYSTYIGELGNGRGIAVDEAGDAVVVGTTSSSVFPITPGAFDTTYNGGANDAFVTKVNAQGNGLLVSSYLGGTGLDGETASSVALDSVGNIYVVGFTTSSDFPTSSGAYDVSFNGELDGFLVELSASGGTLLYGTFLGGAFVDVALGVAVSPSGIVSVGGTTESDTFATTGFGVRDTLSGFVATFTQAGSGSDTAGVYQLTGGAWFLKNTNAPGNADLVFTFGGGGSDLVAIRGDWNGDGIDTPGLYVKSTGVFFLKNTNAGGPADITFSFGAGNQGYIPITGDWNGDGTDTIGLYVPATGVFFLRNTNASGPADITLSFGAGGTGIEPVAGDWNNDGTDTIGLYVQASGVFFLRNTNAPGPADITVGYGPAGLQWHAVTGDFNADGTDTIGLYDPASGFFYLRNLNQPGGADLTFGFGPTGITPLAGDWNGL